MIRQCRYLAHYLTALDRPRLAQSRLHREAWLGSGIDQIKGRISRTVLILLGVKMLSIGIVAYLVENSTINTYTSYTTALRFTLGENGRLFERMLNRQTLSFAP